MIKTKHTTSYVKDESYKMARQASTHSICTRCGGLMVSDVYVDLMNSTSELECTARRCVQCGDVVDTVILRNRSLHQPSTTTQRKPVYVH
jgi:hypothetical protein